MISPFCVSQVRRTHGFARRICKPVFDKEKDGGVPLSQYDMAEVLLVFSGLTLYVMENIFRSGERLPEEDRKAMVHTWRVIGYYLGVQDQYNVCASVDKLDQYTEEFVATFPARVDTCRPICINLRDKAIMGFGLWSGLGVEFWKGLFTIACKSPCWGLQHVYEGNHPFRIDLPFGSEWCIRKYLIRWVSLKINLDIMFQKRDEVDTKTATAWKFVIRQSVMCKYVDRFVWRAIPVHMSIFMAIIGSLVHTILHGEDPIWFAVQLFVAVLIPVIILILTIFIEGQVAAWRLIN